MRQTMPDDLSRDFPKTATAIEARFATEEDCRAYWIDARWRGKPACARCSSTRVWTIREGTTFECADCGHQTSLTSDGWLKSNRNRWVEDRALTWRLGGQTPSSYFETRLQEVDTERSSLIFGVRGLVRGGAVVLIEQPAQAISGQDGLASIPTASTAVVTLLAWGEEYVDRLLRFTLPALLASGNYPCLAQAFDCELVILTEKSLFATLKQSEILRAFERHGRVRLVAIDDLLIGPGSYGLTLTLAFFRVLKEFGPRMVDTWFLFLNADFILADDSYCTLLPLLQKGEPGVICSPSYCTIEENVLPIIERHRVHGKAAISLPKRDMAEIILGNLHDTVLGQQIDGTYHFDHGYLYQAYLRPNARILLGYQMPVAIVALRPTLHVEMMTTFWDWGGVSELCPGGREIVLGDSDDFLMLELRTRSVAGDLLRLGPPTPEHVVSNLSRQLTRDQIHFGQFPLTLHACDLPPDIERLREPLRAFYQRMLALLDHGCVEHRNHPDWLLHYGYYREKEASDQLYIFDDRARAKFIAASGDALSNALIGAYGEALTAVTQRETVKVLGRMKREFSRLLEKSFFREDGFDSRRLVEFLEEYRALVFRHHRELIGHEQKKFYLPGIVSSPHTELQRYERRIVRLQGQDASARPATGRRRLSLDQPSIMQPIGPATGRRLTPGGLLRSLAIRILGRAPHVSMYHPYWAVFRNVVTLLDRHVGPQTKALIISDFPVSGIQLLLQEKSAKVGKISVSDAVDGLASSHDKFDLCFCELTPLQFTHVRQIYRNVLGAMAGNSKVLVFINNAAAMEFPVNNPEFVSGALSVGAPLKIYYGGSELSVRALREYSRSTTSSWRSPLKAGLALLQWVHLAYKANRAEEKQRREPAAMPSRHCTSVTIEIDVPDFMVSQHQQITAG